ncbi:MAG TPA: GNAT family protein [Bacteroidia bacterium]|nr:GNAT family protein [Bacteroidia bacterium]
MEATADIIIQGNRLELKEYQLPLAGMFYNLVAKNKNRLEQSFPVTVESCETAESTKDLLVRFSHERRGGIMLTYGIYLKDKPELIGHIFAKSIEWKIPKCELGYWIGSGYEGQGYTTEALTLLAAHCFEKLKMKKLFIRIIPGNEASRRVAEKAGFVKEGVLRNEFRTYNNQLVDVEYYGKTI